MSNLNATWVIGQYTGERAKSVLAHSEAGIGYVILDRDAGGKNILAAFRWASVDEPIPEHLTEVKDTMKIAEFERTRKTR